MSEHGVVLFQTSSAAFAAEKALTRAGLRCKLAPVPSEFSSDCGVAARIAWAEADAVKQALESAGIEAVGIHRLQGPT